MKEEKERQVNSEDLLKELKEIKDLLEKKNTYMPYVPPTPYYPPYPYGQWYPWYYLEYDPNYRFTWTYQTAIHNY